jgi:hypothetical protein
MYPILKHVRRCKHCDLHPLTCYKKVGPILKHVRRYKHHDLHLKWKEFFFSQC